MTRKKTFRCCSTLKNTDTDRNEEDASEQGPRESGFNDLCVTFAPGAMTLQQGGDVEGHLGDGAERGVHYCPHCEVTLSRDTERRITSIMFNSTWTESLAHPSAKVCTPRRCDL